MEKPISEYKQRKIDLIEKSFTDELKANAFVMDVEFDSLQVTPDRLDIYENGRIMRIPIELNDHNKEVLSKFIKDFDAYNELIAHGYDNITIENQTDLISIIDYVEESHNDLLFYDVDAEVFYYETNEKLR